MEGSVLQVHRFKAAFSVYTGKFPTQPSTEGLDKADLKRNRQLCDIKTTAFTARFNKFEARPII